VLNCIAAAVCSTAVIFDFYSLIGGEITMGYDQCIKLRDIPQQTHTFLHLFQTCFSANIFKQAVGPGVLQTFCL